MSRKVLESENTTARSDAPDAVVSETARTSLVVYYRHGAVVCPWDEGAEVVAGRSLEADLTIDDPSLSRTHARFVWRDEVPWVEDLGSTNGTRVNGKKVREGRLRTGDVVWLGSVAVSLHELTAEATRQYGIEGFDRFREGLEDEVLRAKTFERNVGVIFVQSAPGEQARLDWWCPRLRKLLRPVDRVGLYGPNALLLTIVEGDAERTRQTAEQVADSVSPRVRCGWATYPEHAASAGELVSEAREAARQTTKRCPATGAAPRHDGGARHTRQADLVVASPQMKEVLSLAKKVARSTLPAIVEGPTGTGKELVARAIHEEGPRRKKKLCCVNCAAIPQSLIESTLFGHERGAFTGADKVREGLFETADGGTLFLDEIGELPAHAQAALLRVLETGRFPRVGSTHEIEVDVRIIAATHRDLTGMVESGEFRSDLLYRLNGVVIRVPPLRERREDILPLAELFLHQTARADGRRRMRIDDGAAALLRAYDWPGNVRELRNVVERAAIFALDDVLTVAELPDALQETGDVRPREATTGSQDGIRQAVGQTEQQLLLDALEANDWNQSRTAKALGMPRRTLVYKLRRYGIRRKDLG